MRKPLFLVISQSWGASSPEGMKRWRKATNLQASGLLATRERQTIYLLGKLLLSTLLLLHDLWNGCRGFLSLPFLELIDFVSVVGMVRIIGVQEIEFGVIDLILTDSGFKFRTISGKLKSKSRCQKVIKIATQRLPNIIIDFLYNTSKQSTARTSQRPATPCLISQVIFKSWPPCTLRSDQEQGSDITVLEEACLAFAFQDLYKVKSVLVSKGYKKQIIVFAPWHFFQASSRSFISCA